MATPHRRRARQEHGFTLIEVLIAVTVMSFGVAATMRAFGAAGRTTLSAQAHQVAVQQAQAELERLASLAYGELALSGMPMQSADPVHPGFKVAGTGFTVRAGLSEQLVLAATPPATPKVEPGPDTFAVGTAGGTITGKLYRYVTWRDETCPLSLCDGSENTKRLTVAAVVDAAYRSSKRPPVWVSTIISDPATAPPGSQAPPGAAPGDGEPVTAQSFYLYDTPCSNTTRQPQAGGHPTRDTAATGDTAEESSTCDNPDAQRQPDLMASSAPPGDPDTPLFDYSDDLVGTYDGGLATARAGSDCVHSYDSADAADPQGPSKWSVHAWSTSALPQLFHLDGQVTLSLFTATVGATTATGRLCATLVDRTVTSGVPSDRVIGTVTYDLASWPRSVRRVTFTFHLPQAEDIAAGHSLLLVLHAREESTHDLLFVYDHPLYQSLLEVATTTPL